MAKTILRSGAVDFIRFKTDAGVDKKGAFIYKNVTFSNVSADLTDNDFFEVAGAIQSLMAPNVAEIRRIGNAILDAYEM